MRLAVLALAACTGGKHTPGQDSAPAESRPEDSPGSDSGPDDSEADDSGPETLTFAQDIWPLHLSKCADCHEYWGTTAADAWATLQDPMVKDPPLLVPGDPESSWYYLVMTESPPTAERMPYPVEPLSASQLQAVRDWIAAGATSEGLWPAFGEVYRSSGRCMSCHGDWGLDPSALYTTLTSRSTGGYRYVEPGEPDQSLLYLKLAEGTAPFGAQMPLALDPLDAEQLERVRAWVAVGAPLE